MGVMNAPTERYPKTALNPMKNHIKPTFAYDFLGFPNWGTIFYIASGNSATLPVTKTLTLEVERRKVVPQ